MAHIADPMNVNVRFNKKPVYKKSSNNASEN